MAKILVLDDVEDAAVLIKRIMEKDGHEVSLFTDEEEALEHARSCKVDLAILDIKLKKMSGLKVLGALKTTDPSIRAIMLTGYPTLETAREALDLGAEAYCVKPIEKEELERQVEEILSGRVAASPA